MNTSDGLCECGCGNEAPTIKCTQRSRGLIRGEKFRFIAGHHNRLRTGENSARWSGGIVDRGDGRTMVLNRNHPKANRRGYVYRYVLVAEKVLGRFLPKGSEIHHFDENHQNDKKNNLVICENRAYHMLLHQRTRAYKACGIVHWRCCARCKRYDNPENMVPHGKGSFVHRRCRSAYQKLYNNRRVMCQNT